MPKTAKHEYRTPTPISSVVAELCYVEWSSEPLYNRCMNPQMGQPQHNCRYRVHSTHISDARGLPTQSSIHCEVRCALLHLVSPISAMMRKPPKIYYDECASRMLSNWRHAMDLSPPHLVVFITTTPRLREQNVSAWL